ncbi:hypothetical protein FGG08_003796 [Glutinoglossum americanum]|uniref:F-box domain-containing protein n=1 Tax=Glutinoglossum americanum TaxID=1670608 RepID=A0A9P8ICN3_9PEZI|nr:hypothetical protein FGG08_003796 [Glutinoglossum americanum]
MDMTPHGDLHHLNFLLHAATVAFRRIMGFLKRIRSRSRIKNPEDHNYDYGSSSANRRQSHGATDIGSKLPLPVLDKIFSYVCPHTQDESYLSSGDSTVGDGCMLCDLRDLAQASLVCSRWNESATKRLYRSVRIDAVHYCIKEIELAEKRKRRSFFERNADPKDAPQQRLQLFSRTVRQSDSLGVLVLLLKMPYMTRETCKTDLAKTVSVLPNLRYVDLPEGFFADDSSCHMLKQELQARCPDIRKMKYVSGSEQSLLSLAQTRCWQGLEIVELSQLNVEITELLRVLSSLPVVREVKINELPWLDDTIFQVTSGPAKFPPLQKLDLHKVPGITAIGLTAYLSRPEVSENLTSLNMSDCGILPSRLHEILASAPYLTCLSITEIVSRPFPAEAIPHLASRSLEIFHYEITSAHGFHGIAKPHHSYYTYLTESLWSGSLPALCTLYVRDDSFPESLVARAPQMRAGEWKQPLDIFTKELDQLEWKFSSLGPVTDLGLSPPRAPSLNPLWSGDARRSMVVGNGFGGFLAVPVDSPGDQNKTGQWKSRENLWP